MFSIVLSDLPETMETEPFKPSRSTSGNISYSVSWNFEEIKPEIRIYRVVEGKEKKSKEITDMEENTIIGEKVKLVAKPLGLLGKEIEDIKWKIEGKFIKDYNISLDYAKLNKKVKLENPEISFSWIRGDFSGKSTQVEVSGTVAGKDVVGKTTFKVYAPKIVKHRIDCSPNVTLGDRYDLSNIKSLPKGVSCQKVDADPEKYYENITKCCTVYPGNWGSLCDLNKIEPGFEAIGKIEMPWIPENGYALQYVQLIIEDCKSMNYWGREKEKKNEEYCIDTSYPYTRLVYPDAKKKEKSKQSLGKENIDNCSGSTCQISMTDTPARQLDNGTIDLLTEASMIHSFKTYLMFRPSNKESDNQSFWIPLEMVTWGWSVEAKRIVDVNDNITSCNKAYQILNSSAPSKSKCSKKTNPDFPIWDCNVLKNDL